MSEWHCSGDNMRTRNILALPPSVVSLKSRALRNRFGQDRPPCETTLFRFAVLLRVLCRSKGNTERPEIVVRNTVPSSHRPVFVERRVISRVREGTIHI